jgi:hypothetical protein
VYGYVDPLPYPLTMIEPDGRVNPYLDEQDREEGWRDLLCAIEEIGLWPNTRPQTATSPNHKLNTAKTNRARLIALRSVESPRASYNPRNRKSIEG